jgi:hypothetical protein
MSNKLGLGGLKKKTEAEFIAEAETPLHTEPKVPPLPGPVMLITRGREKDRDAKMKIVSVHVSLDLLDWIENRTAGSKQAVINALLRMGIAHVEEQYGKIGEAVVTRVP